MSKIGLLSRHVDEEEFGDISGSERFLMFLDKGKDYCERFSDGGHFLLVLGSFFSDGFGVSYDGDELLKSKHFQIII